MIVIFVVAAVGVFLGLRLVVGVGRVLAGLPLWVWAVLVGVVVVAANLA